MYNKEGRFLLLLRIEGDLVSARLLGVNAVFGKVCWMDCRRPCRPAFVAFSHDLVVGGASGRVVRNR
jgi:hypothetical protein